MIGTSVAVSNKVFFGISFFRDSLMLYKTGYGLDLTGSLDVRLRFMVPGASVNRLENSPNLEILHAQCR